MKLKFVATAAVALMLAAPAFAANFDFTDADIGTETEALAVTEFGTVTLSTDGNVALINQESNSNIAYIGQSGQTNFAAIVQGVNEGSVAMIYQIGDSNRAAIIQK